MSQQTKKSLWFTIIFFNVKKLVIVDIKDIRGIKDDGEIQTSTPLKQDNPTWYHCQTLQLSLWPVTGHMTAG